MKQQINLTIALLSLAALFAVTPYSAWALTAANTQIVNNASLTYNDGVIARTANAVPVIVTVTLVPGTPIVSKGPDQTTPYIGTDTQLTNTFTVTASNTNGPDSYSLTPAIIAATNASGASLTLTSPASPAVLGATVTLAGSTATVLNVPADGNSGDSQVNGIAVNDLIVVNNDLANPRLVTAITDNASGTSTITVAPALTGGAPGAGVLVAEQKTVTVTLKSGTITTAGQSIVITKQLTIKSTTDPSKSADTSATPTTDTYTNGKLNLSKYVRNVDRLPTMTGTGTKYTYNSNDYWPAGITAKPGETLEYILVGSNAGTGSVAAANIADMLPTSYVTLKLLAYNGSSADFTYDNNGTISYLTAASGDDQATYAAPNLSVNVGTGSSFASGGNIPINGVIRVLYQVSVN
jgi:hypothetical protein